MKTQCPVCDTLNATPDDPGLDPEVQIRCVGCHALFPVSQDALVDALFGPPLDDDPFLPQTHDPRDAFGHWPELPEVDPLDPTFGLDDARWPDPDMPTFDPDPPAPSTERSEQARPQTRRTFDPNTPLPIPERRPAPKLPGLPPAFKPSPALELAARDLPSSRPIGALVGLVDNKPDLHRAHGPSSGASDPDRRRHSGDRADGVSDGVSERRPTPPAVKVFVGAVLLATLAAVTWLALGEHIADLGRDALAELNTPASGPAAVAERDQPLATPPQPQIVGNYVEHIQTRPDGSTVRVWAPRDGASELGTGQPPRPPRLTNPLKSKEKKTGAPAPPLALRSPDGQTVTLQSLRGKVVVLNFFATWCEPCKRELPDFARFHDTIKDKDQIQLYGVVMESGAPDQALAGALKMGVTWPVLAGSIATKHSLRLQGYPTTLIIDPEGNIQHTVIGTLNYARLTNLTQSALP